MLLPLEKSKIEQRLKEIDELEAEQELKEYFKNFKLAG